ncbi:lysylphosphatidylglycerol synthase domain-containing protein [Paraburkholderia rhizosphaerae]|nr:lysylphosphatidylglycerol synthase domain-containing protein [Paraburkholderia rhizosphaerae]
MRYVGRFAAAAGLLVSLWLVMQDDPDTVLNLLRASAVGLVVAALAHVLHMFANARAWQTLMLAPRAPRYLTMLGLLWIRESINGLLPVVRIGGDVVSFRLLVKSGLLSSMAAASLIVDMQLTVISQLLFAAISVGYLFAYVQSATLHIVSHLAWGIVVIAPAFAIFALIQHANPFERLTRVLDRIASGKLAELVGKSASIDETIKRIWRHRAVILRYLLIWQPLQVCGTTLQIWLALYFLGSPVSFLQAFVIDSLVQAVNNAAFFVPAALGVQEGGFLLIGGMLGLEPATCLALAGARRVRDLVIFVPGMLAWQIAESRISGTGRASGTTGPDATTGIASGADADGLER